MTEDAKNARHESAGLEKGIVIVQFCKCKCSLDNAKRSFFQSVNALFSKIGRIAFEEVFCIY